MAAAADPERTLLQALRVGRNETQVTRAYAALAAADSSLPRHIARTVLDVAAKSGSRRAADALERLPASVTIAHEKSLGPVGGVLRPRGGRADWWFTSGTTFGLLVEAKIGAGQGRDQLERYLNDAREFEAGGLVLLTRRPEQVPPWLAGRKQWLGQIHWHDLLPALAKIRPADPTVRGLWAAWTDVLRTASGDLADAPVGWRLEGRTAGQRNEQLLRAAATHLKRSVGVALATRDRRAPEALCGLSAGPRTKNPQRSGDEAFLTFYVPATSVWSTLQVSVTGTRAPLKVTTRAHPGEPARGRQGKKRQQSIDALEKLGLVANRHGWYELQDRIAPNDPDDDDAVAAVCACAEQRLTAIISSGALDHLV